MLRHFNRGTIVFKTLRSSHATLARELSLSQEEYEKLEVSFARFGTLLLQLDNTL